ARQEAARQEAARQEAARQQAAAAQAARAEAARQKEAQAAAAQAEAARAEAARAEAAARAQAERDEHEARREARLREIGRQLNEEAARREAESRRDPSASPLRRARLLGRVDANEDLVRYGEAFAQRIQMNPSALDPVREAIRQRHTDPVVTVAVRSDGSVESVTLVRSSGVPAIDEAIARIVQGLANYPPFPPNLARQYDVVEIRRSWHFDVAVRLY
ncbi:TonB family protein, partial [Hydrogenophaga sp. T2]|uniref:TonB family protein n=1 Tax=Hydrogenophaga sp. T2 TaxID=3132823 RepID=UPI003CEBE5A8